MAVHELEQKRDKLAMGIQGSFPALLPELLPLLQKVPAICVNTESCITLAKNIVAHIEKYAQKNQETCSENRASENTTQTGRKSNEKVTQTNGQIRKPAEQKEERAHGTALKSSQDYETASSISTPREGCDDNANSEQQPFSLQELLAHPDSLMHKDIGGMAGKLLEAVSQTCENTRLEVAIPRMTQNSPLQPRDISDIRQKTSALRTRLTALMQSKILTRNYAGRSGKLDTKRISRLAGGDCKIFARRSERQGINTAVHILLDASASMQFNDKITLACHACYAIAEILHKISGVAVSVTSFPNGSTYSKVNGEKSWTTLCPILAYKQKFHTNFQIPANGSTPMAPALWWVLQQMKARQEKRKILLILSDGDPDNLEETLNALSAHRTHGHEVYGIGIGTSSIRNLLEDKFCKAIFDLRELAQGIFTMLIPNLVRPI